MLKAGRNVAGPNSEIAVFRKPLLAAGMAAALFVPAGAGLCATGPATEADASAARGLQVAERNCSQCHAIGGMGESPNPKSPPFRMLHRRYPADSLADAFQKGLLTHHRAMPKIRLRPDEMADLVAYFKALRSEGATEASLSVRPPA